MRGQPLCRRPRKPSAFDPFATGTAVGGSACAAMMVLVVWVVADRHMEWIIQLYGILGYVIPLLQGVKWVIWSVSHEVRRYYA